MPDGNVNDKKRTEEPLTIGGFSEVVKEENTEPSANEKGILILAVKRGINDITPVDEGMYGGLSIDPEGRLRVSSKPAIYDDIVGNITAIQATIGTPVVGGTVEGDVSRASNLMIFCTGTFSGINCTFEGSLEDTGNTNWFAVNAARSNANTVELVTGALSAQPAYAWELSVNALKRFRVRATARTSGTQSWRFVQGTYATEPIPISQVTGTQPVSLSGGTVTSTIATPVTGNGTSTHATYVSAATVNNTLVKNTVGVISDIEVCNNSASWAYLKLYNKATAPVAGTDTPLKQIGIPPGDSFPVTFSAPFNRFPLGIGFAITRGIALNDNTAVGASEVSVSISYT